jgi:transcriptional regulator with XRE-family HTH domain
MLYSAQIRAARSLLGWSQSDFAKRAGVGLATLQRIEQADGIVRANFSTVLKIQSAFDLAGVRFLDEDDTGGVGVRLTKAKTHPKPKAR